MALPPLLVKIGADTKDLDKGLGVAGARLAKFAAAGVAAAGAVGVAMVGLTKASLANIDVLAKQARSLGLTTAAFQKMSLVAGEAGVEAGKLSSMLGLMQRNIVELQDGTAKQTEVFGKLGLSIRDLQGLEPDAQFEKIADSLSSITDPAEKTALAMEVFGRSGRDAINMLDGYASAASNAEAFQRRFGISVSQDVSQNVERANDAVGRLGQVFTGLGNQMAGAVAPAIERVANGIVEFAGRIIGAKLTLEEFFGTIEEARRVLGTDLVNKIIKAGGSIAELNDEVQGVDVAMGALTHQTQLTEGRLEAFAVQLDKIEEFGASEVLRGFIGEMMEAREELDANIITGEEYRAKLLQIQERAKSLVTTFEDVNGVDFRGAISQLNTLGNAVLVVLAKARALNAELPGGQTEQTTGTGLTVEDGNLLPPSRLAPTTSLRPQLPGVDFGTAPSSGGSGGGGGGGLQDEFARRLEIIMEGLQTERETVQAWYDEGLEVLQTARERELLTEAEYMDQRERLEKEHQERISRIKEAGVANDMNILLGAGKEVLTAMGTHNKKALKVAQVFGAAQALISAYQGAAEALKLPFPKNIAAAATVLAKGIGFVSAIKGVNASSGSGGGSSGGGGSSAASAPAQAPAQQNVQTLNFSVVNDPFGISDRVVRQIVGAINESQRNGSNLIRATVS